MESACKVHKKTQNDKSVNSISQSRNNSCCRSANSPAEKIRFLQRTAGNQAVQRLIKSGALQAKLRVGQPNDIYEQEADRVAEQVMRMSSICRKEDEERLHVKPICSQISSLVQREEVDPEEIEEDVGSVQRNEIGGNEGLRPTPRRVAASARVQGANALDCALERLTEAIHSMERNESIPNDVYFALRRFFPDESPDFLHLLRRRIEGVRSIIETVRIRYVFRPLPLFEPATSLDTTAFAINYILERGSPPAQALPLESPNFILVIPPFYRERNLQATRIVHECFHIYYPTIRHTPRERPRRNAFSYQGFVSMLGGLDQVAPLELFPEPGSECEEKEISRQPNTEEELLQTKETIKQNAETTPDLESRINAIRGGGQPLAESERTFYEPRFGYDFSGVRVHTGVEANETARMLNALAYTIGNDVVFRSGQYAYETSSGRKLLAHELAHIIQQGTGSQLSPHIQRVVDWRTLYQRCCNETFSGRRRLIWGGRRIPSLAAINLILAVTGNGTGGYGPEDLATVWAIESNFTLRPLNNLNANGSVDIGPAQINYQANSPRMSQRRRNAIFGTNLGGGERFNGSPESNLRYAWIFLQRRGHGGYNPRSTRRLPVVRILLPELRRLFRCMLSARTITFSESEA